MVAGGGGGNGRYIGKTLQGGAAGGLIGNGGNYVANSTPTLSTTTGGTQTSGGYGPNRVQNNGVFGYSNKRADMLYGTGGGGGYYGGGSGCSETNVVYSGAGGSSFISGHDGCDAIKEESTEDGISHTGQSIHYSGLYFTDTLMVDGEGYKWTTEKGSYTGMPTHDGTGTMKGNTGNGYARITYIG